MKKYIPLYLLASCVSLYSADEVVRTQKTVNMNGVYQEGTSWERATISANNSADTEVNLVVNSTQDKKANTGYMYTANNKTIRSLKATDSIAANGKGGFNLANSAGQPNGTTALTVDINSTTTDTAIDVAWWKQNYAKVIVKNSASNTTAINVNLGEYLELFGGTNVQHQQFVFDNITANVNVGTVKLGTNNSGDTSTLQITNTATVNLNSGIEVGNSKAPVVVDVAGKLVTTGTVNVYANAKFNVSGVYQNNTKNFVVKKGGEVDVSGIFNQNASVVVESGGLMNVSGKIALNSTSLSVKNGATMNVTGELITGGGSYLVVSGTMNLLTTNPTKRLEIFSVNTVNSTGGMFTQAVADDSVVADNRGIQINRSAYMNGAIWSIDEALVLRGAVVGTNDHNITTAKLYMNEGSKLSLYKRDGATARVIMYNMSQMYLNTENCITDQNGDAVAIVVAVDSLTGAKDHVADIYLNSNQTFTNIDMFQDLNIYLDDSSTLTLTRDSDTIFLSDINSILTIYGFEDNRIYVGESNSVYNVLGNIKAYGDLDGKEAISGLTVQNGWLVSAVPEPAEWAMILGALALGLAVYRKRK